MAGVIEKLPPNYHCRFEGNLSKGIDWFFDLLGCLLLEGNAECSAEKTLHRGNNRKLGTPVPVQECVKVCCGKQMHLGRMTFSSLARRK